MSGNTAGCDGRSHGTAGDGSVNDFGSNDFLRAARRRRCGRRRGLLRRIGA